MTRQEPDERYSATVRAALVEMADRADRVGRPDARRPRWLLQSVVAVVVLGLVVTVSSLVLQMSGSHGHAVPAATDAGVPIADPSLVSCGTGRDEGLAPFGCDEYVSIDGYTAAGTVAWFRTTTMIVTFVDADGRPTIGVGAGCNGFGARVNLSTTRLTVDATHADVTDVACADDHVGDALDFFRAPVAYSLSGDELTLDNGTTVIHLRGQPEQRR